MAADMNCAEFAIRLEAGIDDAARRHLAACAPCRRRREAFDAEEATLRRALRPLSGFDVPLGLESRLLASLPARRPRRFLRVARVALLGLGVAAASVVIAVSLRDREIGSPPAPVEPIAPPSPIVASPMRFDAETRRLSLADGSELRLSPGSDAEFEAVAGTRGRLRLHQGELYAVAAPGEAPLLVEAPGLRARTNDARFLAASLPRGPESSGTNEARAAAVYVLAGHVAVEDGPPSVVALAGRQSCPRENRALPISCTSCHDSPGRLAREFFDLMVPGPRDGRGAEASVRNSGAVEGRVLDAYGNALSSAFVRLRRPGENPIAVKTDEAGRFAFREVEPGSYEVAATADGYLDGSETATVIAGETSVFPVIALREERRLSGRVVDRHGAPVAGARVHAFPVAAEGSPRLPEPATGFSFPAIDGLIGRDVESRLPKAMTQLRIGSTEKLLVDVRAALHTHPDLEKIGFPSNVRFAVSDTDIPVRTQIRLAWSKDSTLVVADLSGGRGTETDPDGFFHIRGLGEGPYTVSATIPDWIQIGEPPSVPGGESGLEIVLAPGGEIRGTVYGPDGLPMAGARVNDAVTDSEGRYRITGRSTGVVDLFAGAAGPNRIVFMRYADSADRVAVPELSSVQLDRDKRHEIIVRNGQITVTPDATPDASRPGIAIRRDVPVSEGQVTHGIDFHLPHARVADGFVVDDDGAPVAGALVEFRANEEIPCFPAHRLATSGEDGYFRLSGVFDVAGSIVASAAGHFESEPSEAGPEAVVTGLRLTVPRAAGVRGEVAAPAMLRLTRQDVGESESPAAESHRIAPESPESVAFRVGDLRPGRYAARAESEAGESVDLGVLDLAPGETVDLGDLSVLLGLR